MKADTKNVSKVVIMWKNKCLFLSRVDKKGWELPGGHLNVGETFTQGAKREVEEETGMRLTKFKTLIKQNDFRLFQARPKIIKVHLSDEHIDYKWVGVREICKLKLTKSTLLNLKTILNAVK